jgi:hypothetical protein
VHLVSEEVADGPSGTGGNWEVTRHGGDVVDERGLRLEVSMAWIRHYEPRISTTKESSLRYATTSKDGDRRSAAP